MASPAPGEATLSGQTRAATAAACEACRKLKMRCIRSNNQERNDGSTEPCERCKRTNRACNIPEPRPLGRKRGAVGRYQGFEKAYRKMQSELKKARLSREAESVQEIVNVPARDEPILDILLSNDPEEISPGLQSPQGSSAPFTESVQMAIQDSTRRTDIVSPAAYALCSESSQPSQEPISNPLALLADASDAAQVLEPLSSPAYTSPASNGAPSTTQQMRGLTADGGFGRRLLRRPGYVSLGLQLDRESLEQGLDALLAPRENESWYSNYFKSPARMPLRDIGHDLDPVDLGLVTMQEAYYLFPIYFTRLHPVNGILDPILHTPEFVRSRSALLFTWILALTAQFDPASASIAKRLRLHGEKLSKYVHTRGYKSVEIVQGYYICLLSATPSETLAEERSWLYTMYAFGVAAELGLDQESNPRNEDSRPSHHVFASHVEQRKNDLSALRPGDTLPQGTFDHAFGDSVYAQRLARNRERTWLRILLWERANSAACGRTNSFPETELTQNIESWWLHPLASPTDKHTCAFITLRRNLASLQGDLRRQACLIHSESHWVRDLVDATLQPWCETWLPNPLVNVSTSPPEQLSNIFLTYVYMHGRLWTLSFALHSSINGGRDLDEIHQDCFEAAVKCCEVAVRDLQAVGEPLYCMLAPTWAMISYAGVLALKLFPTLFEPRIGCETELLALLSQVSLQLERAGTNPSHRFGIAALLGQHLMMILRARSADLRDSTQYGDGQSDLTYDRNYETQIPIVRQYEAAGNHSCDPLVSNYDPFLTTVDMSMQGDLTGEGFADLFRELFGPGFGGVF